MARSHTTLESRQITVERATRKVYGSLQKIIAGITPRAENGDLRAAKFLCDFAAVDALPRLRTSLPYFQAQADAARAAATASLARAASANVAGGQPATASGAKDEEPIPDHVLYAVKQYMPGFDPEAIEADEETEDEEHCEPAKAE